MKKNIGNCNKTQMQIILSIHFFFLERFVSINLMNHIAKLMLMAWKGTPFRC